MAFSSLSESGFIPTNVQTRKWYPKASKVLISFREWLHSYDDLNRENVEFLRKCSHLFQRVASFLHIRATVKKDKRVAVVLISFREWLHSYSIW